MGRLFGRVRSFLELDYAPIYPSAGFYIRASSLCTGSRAYHELLDLCNPFHVQIMHLIPGLAITV